VPPSPTLTTSVRKATREQRVLSRSIGRNKIKQGATTRVAVHKFVQFTSGEVLKTSRRLKVRAGA
jgi:hypothetical protein